MVTSPVVTPSASSGATSPPAHLPQRWTSDGEEDQRAHAQAQPRGAGRPDDVDHVHGQRGTELHGEHRGEGQPPRRHHQGARVWRHDGFLRAFQSPIRPSRRRCCVAAPRSRPWSRRSRSCTDPLPVVDRVGVVVLELRLDPDHLKTNSPDTRQHPAVGRFVDRHRGMAPLGLEVGQLGVEDLDLALGIVDDDRPADELHRRVVAGGDAVLVGPAGLGAPVRGDVGVVTDDGQPHLHRGLQVRPHRVGTCKVQHQLVTSQREVGRQHERRLGRVDVRHREHPETLRAREPRLPLGGVESPRPRDGSACQRPSGGWAGPTPGSNTDRENRAIPRPTLP